MGKAQIISDDGDGLYTIEVLHDTTAADAQLSKFEAMISDTEDDIDQAESEIDLMETEVSDAESALADAESALEIAEENKTVAEDAMNSDPAYLAAIQDVKDAQNELSAAKAEDPVDEQRVADAESALATAETARDNVATKIAYDNASDIFDDATKTKNDAETALTESTENLNELNDLKDTLELRLTALNKRRDRVQSARDQNFQTQAWCADLTSGLSGDVGTIEPGTERKNGINIQPGASGESAWDVARDGQATPFLTMTVADAMRNFAILPGIQKWRPTYRYGTISNIDFTANTCTVTLDPLTSSIQALNINHQSVFHAVPIEYMSCNAAAFEDGDHVVIEFSPYSTEGQPTVIGFVDHPKPCDIVIKINTINGVDYPIGNFNYKVRLTQPLPCQVTGSSSKGTYTEDFTVVASGQCDASGVATLTLEDGVSINYSYPLQVGIWNAYRFSFITTDWRGACPDRGAYWTEENHPAWTTYPTNGLEDYDFLFDIVQWFNTGLDLRNLTTSSFQNHSGDTLTGYSVDVTGLRYLRRDHYYYKVSNMVCAYGGETYFPCNINEHEYGYAQYVPHDFDNDDFVHTPITPVDMIACYETTSTASCNGGSTGPTYRAYGLESEDREGGYTFGSPGILTNRSGQNPTFEKCSLEYSSDADYWCSWTFSAATQGPEEDEWCLPGDFGAGCPDGALDQGEGMVFEMVLLTDP